MRSGCVRRIAAPRRAEALARARVAGSAAGAGSRSTSSAGRSSRNPLNEAWRTSSSAVRPRYSTSHTSLGATQRMVLSKPSGSARPNLRLGDHAAFPAPRAAPGPDGPSSPCRRRLHSRARHPVVTELQRADRLRLRRRWDVADDHELLAQDALRLDPMVAATRAIGQIRALGNKTFETKAGGMLRTSSARPARDVR